MVLSVLSPQNAINIQLAPSSLASPDYLKPFIFHHKANSHSLINAVAFLWTLSSLYFFFCPEMPEASSYSAQNSTDLSAAISPGSSYLISFCKSLSHLLLAFCFPGFSLLAVCRLCFSLRESGFHFFFFFPGLNSPWLFLSFPPGIQWYTKEEDWGDAGGCVVVIS